MLKLYISPGVLTCTTT